MLVKGIGKCDIAPAEKQKGIIDAAQWCSSENQKGAIAIDFVQW